MEIRPIAPNAGALAGFEAICPLCGMALRNTMRSGLELDAASHAEWHAKKARVALALAEALEDGDEHDPLWDLSGAFQILRTANEEEIR